MHFDEAVNYLLGLGHETLAIKLGLANVERLLAALGNPERAYPAVQIAGTNGKGSTAAMLDHICRAAGPRAGPPPPRLPRRPDRGHEWQSLDRRHARSHLPRRRPPRRPLHLPAPRLDHGAHT